MKNFVNLLQDLDWQDADNYPEGTKIKVLRDNIEFLRLNIYDENHFSVYYMNTFLYLLEGNLMPFLKSIF